MTTGDCDSIAFVSIAPDTPPGDIDALKAALLAERTARRESEARASSAEAMVAHLKLLIAKMKRDRFGASAERGSKLLDQFEMQLEELETAAAEDEAAVSRGEPDTTTVRPSTRAKPLRGPLPAHLPRERVVLPSPKSCPCCGGKLAKLGETITETLESVPCSYKVIQCRSCETVTQPPAPFHVIARGRAGPDLLATILHAKFGEHQPLNRQSERFAREGIDLSVSTLADWVGACTTALTPLILLIHAHVMAGERIHGDDTTVPVLANTATITGRLWTDVRDDRPFGGSSHPAAIFYYSRDRGGTHPRRHLADYQGILQADAYSGSGELYDPDRKPGRILEAACWSHGRRKFFILADLEKSPLAIEAVRQIDAIFDVERDINGLKAEQRYAVRQIRVAPFVAALELWMRGERTKLSRHADVAKAMDYMLKRWDAFTRFIDDGRTCLTNNAAERTLRGIALGCKSWLFAGSDRGGERAAAMYSLIATARLNDVDPRASLADVPARIADHPASRLDELLPWKWQSRIAAAAA